MRERRASGLRTRVEFEKRQAGDSYLGELLRQKEESRQIFHLNIILSREDEGKKKRRAGLIEEGSK